MEETINEEQQNGQHTLTLFDNPQPRCPVVLLLDVSSSMTGEPISQLEEGARQFLQEVSEDPFARLSVEPTIITFGNEVRQILSFESLAGEQPPALPHLHANGWTPMGQAINKGLHEIRKRRAFYKRSGISAYKPWMVLLTDGAPNDDWQGPAAKARQIAESGNMVFFGVGIGPDADMEVLRDILPADKPPARLKGLRFKEFFQWLSDSLGSVSRDSVQKSVNAPPIDDWGESDDDWNF